MMGQIPQSKALQAPLQRPPATFGLAAPEWRPPEVQTIEVSDLFKLLRRHHRLVLAVGAVSFAVGMGFALLSHMRFASAARMYLGELEDKGRYGGDEIGLSSSGHADLGSEIEILMSRSLVTRAVLAAGLNTRVTLPGWSPPRYWRWLLARRSPNLLDVASRELLAVDTSLSNRSASTATFDLLFSTDVDYEVRRQGRHLCDGRLGTAVQCEGLVIHLEPGTERGPVAGSEYSIEVSSLEDTVDEALKALEVSTPTTKVPTSGDTIKVANLHFSDQSPRATASFLDHLMLGYLEERHAWKTEDATAAETFLTTELTKTRSTLDDFQSKLATYRAKSGVVVLDNEAKVMIEEIGQYEEQRVAARLEVDLLASVNEQLRGSKPPVEAYMMGEAKDDTVLAGLASVLSQSQQKLVEAETRYNAPAPEVQNLRAQVDAQLQAIRSYVKSRLARERESLRTLDGIIGQYEDKMKTVPSAEAGLAQLTRETEVYSTMYSQLLRRQQEAALVKASTISKNRVLDAPEVPFREEKLRLGIGLGSAPLGLLIGALIVLARSMASSRIQHSADVQRHLGGAPIFAAVPRFGHYESPAYVEAFRTLRAMVSRTCGYDRGNVVLFTSPCSGDGKTTCAQSLARILSRNGRSVLFVDTGLRHDFPPAAPDERGLGDVLLGRVPWSSAKREIDRASGCGFHAIAGGSDESNDLLSSRAMQDFIAEVRLAYDFVLLEAPSYPAVADTFVLCGIADCVIAVIRLEHTSRAQAADNVRQLCATGLNYGIVLNDVVG
jgi:tyrosine-protein kinase Etk/Wzc